MNATPALVDAASRLVNATPALVDAASRLIGSIVAESAGNLRRSSRSPPWPPIAAASPPIAAPIAPISVPQVLFVRAEPPTSPAPSSR